MIHLIVRRTVHDCPLKFAVCVWNELPRHVTSRHVFTVPASFLAVVSRLIFSAVPFPTCRSACSEVTCVIIELQQSKTECWVLHSLVFLKSNAFRQSGGKRGSRQAATEKKARSPTVAAAF